MERSKSSELVGWVDRHECTDEEVQQLGGYLAVLRVREVQRMTEQMVKAKKGQ